MLTSSFFFDNKYCILFFYQSEIRDKFKCKKNLEWRAKQVVRFLCGIYLNAYIWLCVVAMAPPFLRADPNKNVLDQRDDSE